MIAVFSLPMMRIASPPRPAVTRYCFPGNANRSKTIPKHIKYFDIVLHIFLLSVHICAGILMARILRGLYSHIPAAFASI